MCGSASTLAKNYSLDLPVTEVSGDMLLAELKQGRGDADYSSVAQKYFPGAAENRAGGSAAGRCDLPA